MSSSRGALLSQLKEDGTHIHTPGVLDRHQSETHLTPKTLRKDENVTFLQDQEAMEMYKRARALEEEIQYLREQIAVACVKELRLLREKYALERKFADLRLVMDEKHNEANTSALNELARRKGDLEENLKLTHELKAAEDDRYILTSSMVGLLAAYGNNPRVMNASAISSSVKHLHDQLQWKIRTSHDRIREIAYMAENHAESGSNGKGDPGFGKVNGQLSHSSTGQHTSSPYPHFVEHHHLETTDKPPRRMTDLSEMG